MNPVCIKPWFDFRVWRTTAIMCCRADVWVKHTPKNIEWNAKEFQTLRAKFLAGYKCKDCPYTDLNIDRQLKGFSSLYFSERWGEVKDAVLSKSLVAPSPIFLSLNIGTKCNSNCLMCYRSRLKENEKHTVQSPN